MESGQENTQEKHQTAWTLDQRNLNFEAARSSRHCQIVRMLRRWQKSLLGYRVFLPHNKVYATEANCSNALRTTATFRNMTHDSCSGKWSKESVTVIIKTSHTGTSNLKISSSSTKTAWTSSLSISDFLTNGKTPWRRKLTRKRRKNSSEQYVLL